MNQLSEERRDNNEAIQGLTNVVTRYLTIVQQLSEENREITHQLRDIRRTDTRHRSDISGNRVRDVSTNLRPIFDIFYNYPGSRRNVPTNAEIIQSTRNIIYNEIENPLNTSCPICFDEFTSNQVVTEINGCHHLFRTSEINDWFQSRPTCPVCRYNIIYPMTEPTGPTGSTGPTGPNETSSASIQADLFETPRTPPTRVSPIRTAARIIADMDGLGDFDGIIFEMPATQILSNLSNITTSVRNILSDPSVDEITETVCTIRNFLNR